MTDDGAGAGAHRRGRRGCWRSAGTTFPAHSLPNCSARRCPTICSATGPTSLPPSPSGRGRSSPNARPARPRSASSRRRRRASVAVLEIINDDMPFLVDSVVGELNQRGLDIRLLVHPVFAVERDAAGNADGVQGRRAKTAAGAKASSTFTSKASRRRRGAPRSCARSKTSSPRFASPCRIGGRCWRGCARIIAELRANPPPLAGRRNRRSDAVSANGWRRTISRCSARAITPSPAMPSVLEPMFETGLGLLRSRDVRLLRRWQPAARHHAGNSRVPQSSRGCSSSPRRRCARAVHRRVDMDYIGVKRFDRHGKLVGEYRICGLFTSTAYTRSVRAIPYLRRKVDDVIRRAGFDPCEPFRQGAGQRAGDLSARRVVPDRRGHALSVRARHPAARRASARARAAAARPLRPFRLGPRLRSARALRQPDQGADRRLSRHRVQRRGARLLSVLSPKARWCACTSSSAAPRAKRRIPIAPRSTARSRRSCAAGSTA